MLYIELNFQAFRDLELESHILKEFAQTLSEFDSQSFSTWL